MVTSLRVTNAEVVFDELGSGVPVLLLHGFPATRQLWRDVAPAIAERGFRVIVPDLVGYGASEPSAGVSVDMASQARWMWELLSTLDIERAFIVAHDVGSAAAQLMVIACPTRVRGLVILDGVCGSEWAMDAIESICQWSPEQAHRLFPVLARRLAKTQRMRDILLSYSGEAGGRRLIRAARDLDPAQTSTIAEALRASGVRSLVLWGRDDRYLDLDSVARALAEILNAPLQILPGGHFTPVDCAPEVSAALCEFLARPDLR